MLLAKKMGTAYSRAALVAVMVLSAMSARGQSPLRFGAAQLVDGEPLGSFYTLPTSADLDGDGDQDWVYSVGNYYAVRWLENTGGGPSNYLRHEITSFGSVIPFGRPPIIADLDHDGDLDVLMTGRYLYGGPTPELSWWDQPFDPVSGSWKKRQIRQGFDFGICFAEDLNGDERPDILSFSTGAGVVPMFRAFLNSASGAVEFADYGSPTSADATKKVVRTDIDLDDKVDFIFGGSLGGVSLKRVEVQPGAQPLFSHDSLAIPGRQFSAFAVGDFTGDGKPDLAYSTSVLDDGKSFYQLYTRTNDYPDGTFGAEHFVCRFPAPNDQVLNIEVVDVDNDGMEDLFVRQRFGVYFLPNGGGEEPFARLIAPDVPSLPDNAEFLLLDFDRDGDLDLVGGEQPLAWYANSSTAYIREQTIAESIGDGLFSPGEQCQLQLSLGNLGSSFVGNVSLDLTESSTGINLDSLLVNVGSIARGGTRNVQVPFGIDDSALCGSMLDLVVNVKVDSTIVDQLALPIVIGVLSNEIQLADNSETPNAAIPDADIVIPDPNPHLTPLTRTLNVNIPPGQINSVVLDLDITHSYRGDLLVELSAPDGTNRTVFSGQTNDSGTSLTGPFDVGGFEGKQAAGTYTLKVTDRVEGDTGTLVSWGVTVTATVQNCEQPADVPPPAKSLLAINEPEGSDDVNQDGIIDAADLVPGG